MAYPKEFVFSLGQEGGEIVVNAATFTVEDGALVFWSDTGRIFAVKEWLVVRENSEQPIG